MRIAVVRASAAGWQAVDLDLDAGATVGDAIARSGIDTDGIAGVAVFGERVDAAHVLREGERVELLAPLQADPKDARRSRAARARARSKPGGATR